MDEYVDGKCPNKLYKVLEDRWLAQTHTIEYCLQPMDGNSGNEPIWVDESNLDRGHLAKDTRPELDCRTEARSSE